MKEQDDKLTLQETEQLCRLYMDCTLSVLEETELRYFLTQVDYHTPLIDEVRQIMDIDTCISDKISIDTGFNRKYRLRKGAVYLSIAASVVIATGFGFSLWRVSSHGGVEPQSYYIAYMDGHRLSDEAARLKIEAEKKSADDFIKEMSELETRNQQMMENFFNQ